LLFPLCMDAVLGAGAAAGAGRETGAVASLGLATGATGAAAAAVPGWQRTLLSALIEEHVDPQQVLTRAAELLSRPVPGIQSIRTVADQDWVRLTQSQFDPIEIGDRLVITPSWHDTAPGNRIPIVLDPGLAFGTGSHPTTRLCLQWLEQHLIAGASLIDYGCGSGILAIAAAKLGASVVTAIDIDPQALRASRDNAAINRVELNILSTDQPAPPAADIVVANILSSPLKVLAPMLCQLVRPGGRLVISGVLERQIDEVCAAYAAHLPLTVADVAQGWACLSARKPR